MLLRLKLTARQFLVNFNSYKILYSLARQEYTVEGCELTRDASITTLQAMASSSSSGAAKVVLQSIDGKTFEVDETAAKQCIVDYCKRVVTQPPSGENDIEVNAFVSELVNDDGLISLSCENALDMIKCKDLAHIRRIFSIRQEFTLEEEERI
ncbi:hypothetical protein M9H77_18909 [Catharanthus roseus]|uniref:Uncharacterized protein n=1 Tax=Catharanthus roseus TaxID=4058 RepID=A0ACC0B8U4_CATRO|nr:hypothetical protein M9H77_18909 [Catharanthus roseus]